MKTMLFCRLFYSFYMFYFAIIVPKASVAYNEIAKVGETVEVRCIYNASVEKPYSIVWRHNGNTLTKHESRVQDENTDRYYPILPIGKSSATLQIREVTFKDAGVYSCVIYFSRGKSVEYYTTLQIRGSPMIEMTTKGVTENDFVLSTCCADFALYPNHTTIEWKINDEQISLNNSFVSRSSLGALSNYSFCSNVTFISNRCHHGQLLICSVVGGINSTGVILNITYSPRVRLEGKRKHIIFANKNEMVRLSCIAEGNPKPQVFLEKKISLSMWAKLRVEPFTSECSNDGCTIHIYNVKILSKEDTGTFRCTAKNGVGSEVASEGLNVEFRIFQNILQMILDNIPLLITLLIVCVVLIIAICVKVIHKRLKHKYDLSSAPIRTLNMTDFEIRRSSIENIPDVCRSLRSLSPAKGKMSQSNTEDNSGYQELKRHSSSTDGYESASCVGVETARCEVKYHTLERS